MNGEISKQYEKGLVDLMSIVEPLIDKFKANKNSIDIQQLQLVAEYLITDRELDENHIDELEVELDKEKEKNKKLERLENKIKMRIEQLESEFKEHEEKGLNGLIQKLDCGTRIEALKDLKVK